MKQFINCIMAKDLTQADFEEKVLKSKIPVLVDFWASWCGPCKALIPTLSDVAEEMKGKIEVFKVNVDENADVAVKFRIQSIPAMFLFKNGSVVASRVGGSAKSDLINWIESSI